MNSPEKREKFRFSVGDEIAVHLRIIEPEKENKGKKGEKTRERIQIFDGVVIARKGSGLSETFMVRKVSYGEGVERIFPLHSPFISKIEVKKKGKVRKAKLYYLRDRQKK